MTIIPGRDDLWERDAMPIIRRKLRQIGATEEEIKSGVVTDEQCHGELCRVFRLTVQSPKQAT